MSTSLLCNYTTTSVATTNIIVTIRRSRRRKTVQRCVILAQQEAERIGSVETAAAVVARIISKDRVIVVVCGIPARGKSGDSAPLVSQHPDHHRRHHHRHHRHRRHHHHHQQQQQQQEAVGAAAARRNGVDCSALPVGVEGYAFCIDHSRSGTKHGRISYVPLSLEHTIAVFAWTGSRVVCVVLCCAVSSINIVLRSSFRIRMNAEVASPTLFVWVPSTTSASMVIQSEDEEREDRTVGAGGLRRRRARTTRRRIVPDFTRRRGRHHRQTAPPPPLRPVQSRRASMGPRRRERAVGAEESRTIHIVPRPPCVFVPTPPWTAEGRFVPDFTRRIVAFAAVPQQNYHHHSTSSPVE